MNSGYLREKKIKMPPKKKRPPTNPIVVGTVSTRSTRRQSIVNIEIPKSTRSSKQVEKSTKVPKKTTKKQPKALPEKPKPLPSRLVTRSNKKAIISSDPSQTIEQLVDKDNRALLEILQDWDDIEDEQQSAHSQTSEYIQNNTVDIKPNVDPEYDEYESNSKYSEIQQIELSLAEDFENEDKRSLNNMPADISEAEENLEISQDSNENSEDNAIETEKAEENLDISQSSNENSQDNVMETEKEDKSHNVDDIDCETQSQDDPEESTSENVAEGAEEIIIEDNASIPYADDMIVNDQNEQSNEKSEEVNITEIDNNSISSLEVKDIPESIENIELEVSEGDNSQFSETVQVEENFSENSQQPTETEDYIDNKIEENVEQLSVVEENQECVAETYVQEDTDNYEVSSPIENSEDTKMEEEQSYDIENTLNNNQMEEDENIKMDHNETIESSDETSKLGEDLENEVAKMHLSDDQQKNVVEQTIQNRVSEEMSNMFGIEIVTETSSIASCSTEETIASQSIKDTNKKSDTKGKNKKPNIEEISNKVSDMQLEVSKKLPILSPLFLEDVANSPPVFKIKSKQKHKPKEVKTFEPKQSTDQESKPPKTHKQKHEKSKSPTLKIPKEKKAKESKAAKKSTSKKENSERSDKKEKKHEKSDEINKNGNKTESEGDDEKVRRSSRIKTISELNRKTTGWGLVKSKSESSLFESDVSDSNSFQAESDKSTPTASPKVSSKDRKWKPFSSSEGLSSIKSDNHVMMPFKSHVDLNKRPHKDPVVEGRLKQFVHLKENQYRTDRMVCKEAKKMVCDCFLTPEELHANEYGCGEDCLNRLLLIECGNLCVVGDRCTNKRFQKSAFAPVEVFNTDKKGLGLRAAANIPFGEFILEYVGEVLDNEEFDKRAEVYSQDKNIHYYFMALRADAIIDATMKGNISRFINHSCDPNAETQKWTVNGELRIGFFSTRTVLAGEEITFDYRFQRYGKEAQKCFCGASICRGWLGEQPDSDEEEEEDEEEEIEDTKASIQMPSIKDSEATEISVSTDIKDEIKPEIDQITQNKDFSIEESSQVTVSPSVKPISARKKVQKKKPRIEMFEEVDQLNEEIEMLVTTGLKNQAHTLKLSRLMVRAKEPQQRAKLLRVLRRGELPCRRLFLDYHGLRLMHGYMIDAQQLVIANKKFESLRLEVLQTLAVLPIPNKSMLQDSKVLPTVEKWSSNKDLISPPDSESNSPKNESDLTTKSTDIKVESKLPLRDESVPERSIEDQEEEIRFLATKLLEEWKNLKEVFKIPKKERIEQMKEHEREANKKFMQTNQNTYGSEDDKDRKVDRYRGLSKNKSDRDMYRKPPKPGDKPSAEYLRLSKIERRKLFALQHELKEEERKLKQREMWRQHEMNCMMIGADPRFTAPFDPNRGYQLIWNPQIGQWQNCSMPSNSRMYQSQSHPPQLQHINLPHPVHHIPKNLPAYPAYQSQIGIGNNQAPLPPLPPIPQNTIPSHIPLPPTMQLPPLPTNLPPLPTAMPPLPTAMPPLPPLPTSMPPLPSTPVPQIAPSIQKIEDEDPSQVRFAGPIPPPVKLPPKWKCAKDKYGRPYYYHIKIRKSQWEPPPPEPPEEPIETSESDSSSETSTVSSDSSSENSESDEEVDDTKLLLEVRRQMENLPKLAAKTDIEQHDDTPIATPSPDDDKFTMGDMEVDEIIHRGLSLDDEIKRPSIDMRLKELDLFKEDRPLKRKRRIGLCEEIIISPRTEEDKRQFKEDVKRYKANKEKLKRQKEKILLQTKKQLREIELKKIKEKRPKTTVKVKLKEKPDFNSEAAKKIKETFRTNMASTVVNSLNVYRKPDCTEGRITNTKDFKHLARKLTHFVMLKEMKHISKIEDLTCTDNVKMKAREFIRKYMSKFGEVYVKRSDSPDFKD